MAIIRWDPYRELAAVQERMNRLFEETWGGRGRRADEDSVAASWMPAVDVRETKDALELNVELPGIDPKDVAISVEGGVLTIKGSRTFEKAAEGETYHRIERAYGSFERSFTLPSNVDPERVEARFRQGLLVLVLPKREEARPKSISIKIDDK
jgi:HSP20 family protein